MRERGRPRSIKRTRVGITLRVTMRIDAFAVVIGKSDSARRGVQFYQGGDGCELHPKPRPCDIEIRGLSVSVWNRKIVGRLSSGVIKTAHDIHTHAQCRRRRRAVN
ncbi:hypothetical protein EVAR_36352_1 [Eumeta japonica]|uniref:Uncharacterized protein n=1 Tax=Eumeta variegata TaxID=151549 RepID=A0A4C1W5S9_EUMVA|nr:hypothetical protein EVAR_36352_1 [Eumeta japonica]